MFSLLIRIYIDKYIDIYTHTHWSKGNGGYKPLRPGKPPMHCGNYKWAHFDEFCASQDTEALDVRLSQRPKPPLSQYISFLWAFTEGDVLHLYMVATTHVHPLWTPTVDYRTGLLESQEQHCQIVILCLLWFLTFNPKTVFITQTIISCLNG